nr:hypothetical protein Itr_chr13CG09190 [Ipomoea trifida]
MTAGVRGSSEEGCNERIFISYLLCVAVSSGILESNSSATSGTTAAISECKEDFVANYPSFPAEWLDYDGKMRMITLPCSKGKVLDYWSK